MKNLIASNRPPAKNDKIAMWILAIPKQNAINVVQNNTIMTILINGMSKTPPPGERIWEAKDDMALTSTLIVVECCMKIGDRNYYRWQKK